MSGGRGAPAGSTVADSGSTASGSGGEAAGSGSGGGSTAAGSGSTTGAGVAESSDPLSSPASVVEGGREPTWRVDTAARRRRRVTGLSA
jgi:hypothetical protein